MPKRGEVGKRTPPVVVADFAALDAEWADYIRQGVLAGSGDAYAKRWRRWEKHCDEEGVDPWKAPASAFESLWLMRREADGKSASPETIEGIAVAVSHFYGQKGLTPAHQVPENHGRWKDHRKSARKAVPHSSDPVVPMMRRDAQRLLAAPMPALNTIRRASLLLLLQGFAPAVIDRITAEGITLADDIGAGVTVFGERVACDHEERVPGVPWDCAACAVRDALAELEPGKRFDIGLINKTASLRSRFRLLAGAGEPWGPRQGLTAWETAGLRRAVVLSTAITRGEGYLWVRARAWTGVAWSCGLRMGSDTDRLERADLAPDARGRGWGLRLGATKDDQIGAKGVVRPFSWDDGDGVIVAALIEYACVRDALLGNEGRLFVPLGSKGHGMPLKQAASAAGKDINRLARLAGVEPVFSSYSTRKGFAAQAVADGWTEEQIQEGLRHLHLNTTVTRYLPKQGVKKAARKFADRLAAEAGER